MKKMWEVHIYGEVPQCLLVPAATAEQAVNDALADVLDRLEFKAFPEGGDAPGRPESGGSEPVGAIPPEAKKKRMPATRKKS